MKHVDFDSHSRGQVLLTLAVAAILGAAQAGAQQADTGTGQLEEIVVSAQRRSQPLEEVPISISAFTGESLSEGRVTSVNQLATVVPGMRVDSQGGASQPTIRGVGTATAGVGFTSNVAVYVNGFYIPDQYDTDLQLLNLASVQVLKGPQGTLFGRNATGGAIVLETRDPTFEPSLAMQGTTARYSDNLFNVYGSTGVSDRVAVDAAFIYRQGDGFIDNIATGADDDGRFRRSAYRFTALYADDGGLEVKLAYSGASSREPLYSALAAWEGNSKSIQVGPLIGVTPIIASEDLQVSNTAPTAYSTESNGLYLTIAKDFGGVRFKSLTMDRRSESRTLIDLDSSNLPLFAVEFKPDSTTFSQEFDLTGTSGDLEWVAGAFYMQYDNRFRPLAATEAFGMAPFTIYREASTDDRSYALFADLTYRAFERLYLTAGARYSYEEVDARVKGLSTPVGPVNMPEWSHDWSNVSPRVVARYQLADDSNVYASYSQGYKAGMLQPASFTTEPIDPEKLDAYEVGYKIARERLQFNASAFYYDYKDMQVSSFNGTQALTVNAAASSIYGGDFQFTALVAEGLTLGLGAAYTHGRYDRFPGSQARNLDPASPSYLQIVESDASDNPMMRTPEFTGLANVAYERPLAEGSVRLNADYYYTDAFYFDPNRQFQQGSYGLLDLRAGWVAPGGRLSVTVFCQNVTDEQYVATLLPGDFAIQQMYGTPQSYGITFDYRR